MAFELSFSPEFFFAEGEPYDGGTEPSERPISVWNALESMRVLHPDQWEKLAQEVFNEEGKFLIEETVLEKIQETNTCRNLNSPVEVYIDPKGYFTIKVYELSQD